MRAEMTRIAGGNDSGKIIESCKQLFNQWCGFDFFLKDNLKVKILAPEEGIAGYERFCNQYFPNYLDEYSDDYAADGYIDTFKAQAFINGTLYGILLRSGAADNPVGWYEIILHEMSHIFCIIHEKDGTNFFYTYCTNDESGAIAARYAIWREFIADYMAAHINPYLHLLPVSELRKEVRLDDTNVFWGSQNAKTSVSSVLTSIFLNKQVYSSNNIDDILLYLSNNRIFASKTILDLYARLLDTIFNQISKEKFWEISVDFIESVGSTYVGLLMWKTASLK